MWQIGSNLRVAFGLGNFYSFSLGKQEIRFKSTAIERWLLSELFHINGPLTILPAPQKFPELNHELNEF